MHAGMSEFLEEQAKGLAEMAEGLRKSQVAAARKAAMRSAARIRSLNMRAREMAKSGVRLANLSHGTLQRGVTRQAAFDLEILLHHRGELLGGHGKTDGSTKSPEDTKKLRQSG